MKKIILTLALFAMHAQGNEHSMFVGLYIQHHGAEWFHDYRRFKWFNNRIDLNEGSFENNRLIGYQYAIDHWAAGACYYKNSYYEDTYCAFGAIKHRFLNNWEVVSGLNVTYGYRPALVKQKISEPMGQTIMPAAMVGIRYHWHEWYLEYQYIGVGLSTVNMGMRF